MSDSQKYAFTITRVFDAARQQVFKTWTDPEHLKHWWGPKGFKWVSCKMDLRPGGIFHYCMQSPDGQTMWGKFVYQEIAAPERLVFIVSFSDEAGNSTRHPFAPEWPIEVLTTLSFTELAGKTTLAMQGVPHNATDSERSVFEAGFGSMQNGWSGTFGQLEEYLKSLV